MSALTSLLVRDQRVSVRKIEEAIQRQVISGGTLDTVLLELNQVPEDVMAAYVAATHGLLPATREEVMRVSRDTIRIVPREVAERHRIVPLHMEDRTLVVAVSNPLDADVDQQLGFLLGAELVQRIVTEVRISAALHHHYGIDMVPRVRRLSEKLRDRDAGTIPYVAPLEQNTIEREQLTYERETMDSEHPPSPEGPNTRRFGVVPSESVPDDGIVRVSQVVGVRHSSRPPPPEPSSDRPPSLPPPPTPPRLTEIAQKPREERRVSEPHSELLRKLRGPLTARRAVELLERCEERDDILEVAFAFVRQFFDATFLFVVHEGECEGLDAVGEGVPSYDRVIQITVALDEPSAFGMAVEGGVPVVSHLDVTKADQRVREKLSREERVPAVIVPISIRSRVVLLFVGDRGGEDFGLADIPELLAFTPRLSEAFQKLILRRKFRGYAKSTVAEPVETPREKIPTSPGLPRAPEGWDPREPSPRKSLLPEEAVVAAEQPVVPAAEPGPRTPDTLDELPAAVGEEEASRPGRLKASEASHRKARNATGETAVRIDSGKVGGWDSPPETSDEGSTDTDEPSVEEEAERGSPMAEAVKSSLPPPRRRRKRKRSQVFDVLGVPRDAPPPPSVEESSSPSSVTVASSVPISELPPEAPPPKPSEPPAPLDLVSRKSQPIAEPEEDDDEPDITVEEADPTEIDDALRDEARRSGAGAYRVHGGTTDVVGGSRRSGRPSGRPDPRAEGSSGGLVEVVRVPKKTPTPSEAPPRARPESSKPPTRPNGEEPKVIISMGDHVEEAAQQLARISPEDDAAIAEIVGLGEAVLPVLVRDFPGPLWFDRHQPHRKLPRGRDVSPVARAITRFGDRAVPYVTSLLDREEADARFYALLVAAELPHRELVVPVARRIFDADAQVAALALDVLRATQRRYEKEHAQVIETLRAAARVPRRDPAQRAAAARALGELRDRGSLDLLLRLLDARVEVIVDAAHKALVVLTGQDFGIQSKRWIEWVEAARDTHRIEWLIESLLHADEKIRAHAGDELKQLTQEYYGYHPALPKREREIAHRKYRDWWERSGRSRFVRS